MEANLSNSTVTGESFFSEHIGWFWAMIVLAIIGGYAVTSYVFLRHPEWLHKKKKCKFSASHISHRGGAGENLENTMTAFRHAVHLGTDMLEIDVHLTRDAEVVVSHDDNLRRTTGEEVYVSQTAYQHLPLLQQALKLDFEPDHVVKGTEDRKIVRLREVFDTFPDIPINIDIKADNDLLNQKVNDLIVEYQREEITVWGNKSKAITDKLYKLNPNIPLLFSVKRVLQLLCLYYTGLLPFVPMKESHFEVIMPSVILKHEGAFSRRFRFVLWLADCLLMSKTLFSHLKARGIQVYLWVLNDEDSFDRGFRYGADGVMTDFPTKLSRYLEQNSQYCRKK